MAPVAPQIEAWFHQDRFPYQPNLVPADFDGDGKADIALQIICSRQGKETEEVVVLMDYRSAPKPHRLAADPPDPFTFLVRYAKGEKDFDFETMKPFRYSHDALGVLYLRKTAVTFRWDKDGFQRKEAPSDEEVESR